MRLFPTGSLLLQTAPRPPSFSREQIDSFEQKGFERVSFEGQEIRLEMEDVEINTFSKEGFATFTDSDLTIALDLTLTEDLIEEGLARELINRIQNMRKEIDFAVTDRIEIYIDVKSENLARAIKNREDYIKNETLAINVLSNKVDDLKIKEITIGEKSLLLGLRKT